MLPKIMRIVGWSFIEVLVDLEPTPLQLNLCKMVGENIDPNSERIFSSREQFNIAYMST